MKHHVENLQGGQFNYVINSVDSTKLPCYTLPLTQHYGFLRNLPSFINIFYLLLNYFKTILLFYFSNLFFCGWWSNLWSGPWSDPIWFWFCQGVHILTHSHNYFCMNMYHIIAVRFRCWYFDLTVVHIHTHSRLCSAWAWLQKGIVF